MYVICFSLDLPLVKIQIWLLQGWLGWVSGATRPLMRLVTLSNMPILQQLHLEEQLLRRTSDNWCVINDGMAPATILMGLQESLGACRHTAGPLGPSADCEEVQWRWHVIVDWGTVVVTFICNKNAVAGLQIYGKNFDRFGEFHLRENDYAFSHSKVWRKCSINNKKSLGSSHVVLVGL